MPIGKLWIRTKNFAHISHNNTTAECWKGPKGHQQFPACIGLASVGFIDEDAMFAGIKRRADAFLKEAVRVCDGQTKRIGVVTNVVYNFNKPILQCSCTVYNPEAFDLTRVTRHEYIVFEGIGNGGEEYVVFFTLLVEDQGIYLKDAASVQLRY